MTTTDERVDDFLEHFGVKGMKWGVRKDRDSGSDRKAARKEKKEAKAMARTNKALDKVDKRWEKELNSSQATLKVYNKTAARMNDVEVPRINNKPQYRDADFTNDSPLRRKYYQEFNDAYSKAHSEALMETYGRSPSGRKGLKIDPADGKAEIIDLDVKHAGDPPDPVVRIKFDKKKHVISIELVPADGTLEQAGNFAENFLEHYGVKGMKWGVRRADRTAEAVTVSTSPGKKVKAAGGRYQNASEDAKKAAVAKQKAKASSVDSLSNQELKELNERMNLEQNYRRLAAQDSDARAGVLARGAKFATQILLNTGKQEAQKAANNFASQQIADAMAKKG